MCVVLCAVFAVVACANVYCVSVLCVAVLCVVSCVWCLVCVWCAVLVCLVFGVRRLVCRVCSCVMEFKQVAFLQLRCCVSS